MPLSDRDKQTLHFAGQRYKYAGARETDIRELFDETPTRFWQRVGALLENPEAVAWDAVTVGRLVRLREKRREVRSARV